MAELYQLSEVPLETVNDKLQRRLVWGEQIMLAQMHLAEGCEVPRHSHVNEQVSYVVEGALHFKLGDNGEEEVTVRAGGVLVLRSNLPHSAKALEKSLVIDVFSPPRADWIAGTDHYLRR